MAGPPGDDTAAAQVAADELPGNVPADPGPPEYVGAIAGVAGGVDDDELDTAREERRHAEQAGAQSDVQGTATRPSRERDPEY